MDLEKSIVAGVMALVIYFLKKLMDEHSNLKIEVSKNRTEIELLKQEANNTKSYFNEKFEILFKKIESIDLNIQKLNVKQNEH